MESLKLGTRSCFAFYNTKLYQPRMKYPQTACGPRPINSKGCFKTKVEQVRPDQNQNLDLSP